MLVTKQILVRFPGINRQLITQWREAGKIKGKYNSKYVRWEYYESEIPKIEKLVEIYKSKKNEK